MVGDDLQLAEVGFVGVDRRHDLLRLGFLDRSGAAGEGGEDLLIEGAGHDGAGLAAIGPDRRQHGLQPHFRERQLGAVGARTGAVGRSRIGAAARDVIVRDPLVAEPLLPRFLAPGDTTRLAVLLHSLDLPEGDVAVRLSTDGPLAIAGSAVLTRHLPVGGQVLAGPTARRQVP